MENDSTKWFDYWFYDTYASMQEHLDKQLAQDPFDAFRNLDKSGSMPFCMPMAGLWPTDMKSYLWGKSPDKK